MAKPGRATQAKRSREMAKKEKQTDKEERRTVKKEQKDIRGTASLNGEDPDLIGIFPGPQPVVDEE
jgi:hypothetical protein